METRRTVSCTPIVASTRQGTSSAFSRQAKRLQWEMRWQQYRAAVLAVLLVVWAIGLAVLREHAFGYLAATSAVFVAACLGQRYVRKQWQAQQERDEDTRQLLGPGGDTPEAM
ncbi:unnamed protein product [Prorocentrum cordatum]|uniref:Uncharacterized protein n=1 Tax=Prorocentrum cordatum TaxID=2364126 RepID=A0ABN9VJC5_9DINO|nr:unnamed protein product [Polarella glacialis]